MKTSSTLKFGENVRTQITLSKELKNRVETRAAAEGKSLAEYLREAAIYYLEQKIDNKRTRQQLADQVVGTLDLNNYPEWQTPEKVTDWVEDLRESW